MANAPALTVVTSGRAGSTPTADTTPAQISGNELEQSLHMLQSETAAFAKSTFADPAARAEYERMAKAASDELIERVKQRKVTPHEAAQTANAMRNQIMALARSKLTDFGLAVSRDMKQNGRPLQALEEKYAVERFQRGFARLTTAERQAVWVDIAHAAGRSNAAVNMRVKWYGAAGRVFLVASLASAVYNLATAGDKTRQAAKEGTSFSAGAAGGALAGVAVVALASNPAGWVVGVAMFVGAAVAGASSSEAFDYFWPGR